MSANLSSHQPQFKMGAAIAGLAFAVLLLVALALTASGPCGGFCFARTSDASVVAFYTDAGHRWTVGVAYVLVLVAVFALLWFLAGLRSYVEELEGGDGFLPAVVFGGGLVYMALLGGAVSVFAAAITGPGLVTNETFYRMNAQDVRVAGDIMIAARSMGAAGSAAMVLGASIALLRRRRRGLGWVGAVLGILTLLFGIQEGLVDRGIPVTILVSDLAVIWILVICVTMLAGRMLAHRTTMH